MKLPTQKRLLREDLKDAGPWADPLTNVLNSFMETVYQAMNRNMTFHENIACRIKEITYRTPSTYPLSVPTTKFMSELKTKASGLWVMQAIEKTSYEPAAGPVYAPWVEDNGNIVISTITGLEPDKTYTIRLLIT